MSVVSVRARSFILALFIRDDGERFLLGDNGYDFIDSQLHFSANTIENDEVEKQGADGTMLAGQVRRASVQTFDGYVGDATTPKEEIEQMRREFIAFFAKDHHFRVIYVDCNRNAWQRKGGYLVDAPEVKELWQIHPEYHVGLNFEDVNYYEYDENAEGQEILANIMKVPISSAVEGGLVWDEDGAVSEDATVVYDGDTATASGTSITISDAVEAPLSDFKLKGETSQNGTPTPSAPVAVKTVTGENVVKISGKNLWPINSSIPRYNCSITPDGDSLIIVASGGTNGNIYPSFELDANTQYTFSGSFKITDFVGPAPIGALIQGYNGSSWIVIKDERATISDTSSHDFAVSFNSGSYKSIRVGFGINVYNTSAANTVVLSNPQLEKGSTATEYEPYQGQSYPISLGSIELCGIGDDGAGGYLYKDGIYKNLTDNKWYVHKEVGKYVYNNDLTGNGISSTLVAMLTPALPIAPNLSTLDGAAVSNMYGTISTEITKLGGTTSISCIRVDTSIDIADSYNAVKALAAANNFTIYYALATPTDTEITNETLVAQLEAILSQGKTYAGTNNITTVIAAGNEQGELEITYYTTYEAKVVGGGYVWEEGGSGGPTVIVNESISAVSPVWTVYGPALNPQLENATNGDVIEYVGLIAEGQTLVIDMGEQTAKLDGLNVISNVTGDFISLESGANTLLYSAGNDAPESEIGWSEIVG